MAKKKQVEPEHSYWGGDGRYEAMNAELAKHIPNSGKADNKWIELLRCATNIYYDCYNNGGCNLGVKIEQLRNIVRHRLLLVPSLMTEEAWDGIIPTLLNHAESQEEYDSPRRRFRDDDDDPGPPCYLPNTWSMINLELLIDAIILLVHHNFKEPVKA